MYYNSVKTMTKVGRCLALVDLRRPRVYFKYVSKPLIFNVSLKNSKQLPPLTVTIETKYQMQKLPPSWLVKKPSQTFNFQDNFKLI